MTLKELNVVESDDMLSALDEMRQLIEAGEILSLHVIAERTDGKMMARSTKTDNRFSVAGYMQYWAMRRIGFMDEDEEK